MPFEALPHLLTMRRFQDARGWFSESFHQQRLVELGLTTPFVQDNLSYSRRSGTLRGFHFQSPPAAQSKLVYVMRGKILDVAVDVRRGSPTYGRYVATELTSDSDRYLYIPVGFAHAFVTLCDDVVVMYKVSNYYSPELEGGVRWNDPELAFPWPYSSAEMTISDKDSRLPLLREFDSPFPYDENPLNPGRLDKPVEISE
jgi:dTDP-4-dehydrorhamnose 3,5-epimerase